MSDQTPLPGNGPALPAAVYERLATFAEWTGTVPPETLLDEDGSPSDALLAFCRSQGLSLDWLFRGGVHSLVMRAHRAAREHILNTGFEAGSEDTVWRADLSDVAHHANLLHALASALCKVNDGTTESADMILSLSLTIEEKAKVLALTLEEINDEFGE